MNLRRIALALLGAALVVPVGIAIGATTASSGRTINAVRMIRGQAVNVQIFQDDASNAQRPWVNIPGASTTIRVPTGQAHLLATLVDQHRCTGESAQTPSFSAGWGCEVRVVVNGTPLGQFTVASEFGNPEPKSIDGLTTTQFSTDTPLGPGTYTVGAQYHTAVAVDSIGVQFLIQSYHFTVERVKV